MRKGEIPELPESVKENAVLDMAFNTTLMVDVWLVLLLVSKVDVSLKSIAGTVWYGTLYNFPNLCHKKMCRCASGVPPCYLWYCTLYYMVMVPPEERQRHVSGL